MKQVCFTHKINYSRDEKDINLTNYGEFEIDVHMNRVDIYIGFMYF